MNDKYLVGIETKIEIMKLAVDASNASQNMHSKFQNPIELYKQMAKALATDYFQSKHKPEKG